MEGGDLVVELVAALVEAPMPAARDFLRHREGQLWRTGLLRGARRLRGLEQPGRELQHVEGAARIAVGRACDQLQRPGLDGELRRAETAFAVGERRLLERDQVFRGKCAQHVHPRARQQRAHHLEGRVLGGCADERERAVLEKRQERVLLHLVEAVYLVEEQQRRATLARPHCARGFDRGADILHARHDGRQRDELRVGGLRDEPRQRRLAAARRTPEDQGMKLPRGDARRQRLAGPEDVLLPDELLEIARPHAIGERSQ